MSWWKEKRLNPSFLELKSCEGDNIDIDRDKSANLSYGPQNRTERNAMQLHRLGILRLAYDNFWHLCWVGLGLVGELNIRFGFLGMIVMMMMR